QRLLERVRLRRGGPRRGLDVALLDLLADEFIRLRLGLGGAGEGLGLCLPRGAHLAERHGESVAAHLDVPELVGLRVAVLKGATRRGSGDRGGGCVTAEDCTAGAPGDSSNSVDSAKPAVFS